MAAREKGPFTAARRGVEGLSGRGGETVAPGQALKPFSKMDLPLNLWAWGSGFLFGPWGIIVSQKTGGGRFSGDTDDRVEAFTESISFARRLYRQDITASQAHARMLAEVGLLTAEEAAQIVGA